MGEAKRRRARDGYFAADDEKADALLGAGRPVQLHLLGAKRLIISAITAPEAWEGPSMHVSRLAFGMVSRIDTGELRPWHCVLCDVAFSGLGALQAIAVADHADTPPTRDKMGVLAAVCCRCAAAGVEETASRVMTALGFDLPPSPPPRTATVLREGVGVNALGQTFPYRETNTTPSEVLADATAAVAGYDANVPCYGCRECCWHKRVDVYPRLEDTTGLDVVRDEKGFFLRKRTDGACVHLGEHGCSVYARRPVACRSYDCRTGVLAGIMERFDGGHTAPGWVFTPETDEDEAIMRTAQVISMIGALQAKAGAKPLAVAEGLKRFKEALPIVRDMVTKLKAMPAEERKKIEDFADADIMRLLGDQASLVASTDAEASP